jgi:hypothetical protein
LAIRQFDQPIKRLDSYPYISYVLAVERRGDFCPCSRTTPRIGESARWQALERLGLKLEARKVSAEVLFVDHVERLSPNCSRASVSVDAGSPT